MSDLYFLGGPTALGFKSRFEDLISSDGFFTFILKGGPGTGKSTLMKRVAEHFKDNDVELYYCASDTRSLDAVVICDLKTIIVDGTAPHVFNADFPGVSQCIIDLGEFWERKKLIENESSIKRLFMENASYHKMAQNFISALTEVNSVIYNLAASFVDLHAISEKAEGFIEKIIGVSAGQKSSVVYKQLSAMTSGGYQTQSPNEKCRTVGIKDDCFAAGSILLEKISEILLERGFSITVSECDMLSKSIIEHIYIAELNLRISLVDKLNKLDCPTELECAQFYGAPLPEEIKRAEILAESIAREISLSISKALEIHDELESFYINSLDVEGLNTKTRQIINLIHDL